MSNMEKTTIDVREHQCPTCLGSGWVVDLTDVRKCPDCHGWGTINDGILIK